MIEVRPSFLKVYIFRSTGEKKLTCRRVRILDAKQYGSEYP